MFESLPLLASVIFAVLAMIVGMVWYAPGVFGTAWMNAIGLNPQNMGEKPGPGVMITAFLTSMVKFLAFAALVAYGGAEMLGDYIKIALLVWLGFLMTYDIGGVLWSGHKKSVLLVNGGYNLVVMLVAALVLYLL